MNIIMREAVATVCRGIGIGTNTGIEQATLREVPPVRPPVAAVFWGVLVQQLLFVSIMYW